MKKIKNAIFLSFIISLAICHSQMQEPEADKKRWISRERGAALRKSPKINAKEFAKIPFAEQVQLFSKVLEKKSKHNKNWRKIKWKNMTGWVFDESLSEKRPQPVDNSLDLLDSIPENWINIINKNGSYIVYHYCDAGARTIKITDYKNDRKIIWHFLGQESDGWLIEKINSAPNGKLIFQVKNLTGKSGKVIFSYINPSKKNKTIWIFPDQKRSIYVEAKSSENLMMNAKNEKAFPTIRQSPSECY
jgi:hypothetical protein